MMTALAVKTVLVVEDVADTRDGLEIVLRDAGYDVALAADGRQALDYLHSNAAPDVILLDMLMPVVDGWRFLEQMDELDPQPRPQIIIITASPAIGHDWAMAHGCQGVLRKPVAMPDLLDEIRRCEQSSS